MVRFDSNAHSIVKLVDGKKNIRIATCYSKLYAQIGIISWLVLFVFRSNKIDFNIFEYSDISLM